MLYLQTRSSEKRACVSAREDRFDIHTKGVSMHDWSVRIGPIWTQNFIKHLYSSSSLKKGMYTHAHTETWPLLSSKIYVHLYW
jgi:hypothetical protein